MLLPGAAVVTGGGAADNEAREELMLMRGEMDTLVEAVLTMREEVAALETQISNLQFASAAPSPLQDGQDGSGVAVMSLGPNTLAERYAEVVNVADRRNLNFGLEIASPRFLIETFGMPREPMGADCQQPTNPRLTAKLETRRVGEFDVTMLVPALDSLEQVLANIERADPELHARIHTAGATCARWVRGSTTSVSNHSFGLAIDLTIDGVLDGFGDGRTQLGLTILADFFNAEGWYWGAAFGREDSMHFEVGRAKVEQWVAEGLL